VELFSLRVITVVAPYLRCVYSQFTPYQLCNEAIHATAPTPGTV
jgi:hypothetical protein